VVHCIACSVRGADLALGSASAAPNLPPSSSSPSAGPPARYSARFFGRWPVVDWSAYVAGVYPGEGMRDALHRVLGAGGCSGPLSGKRSASVSGVGPRASSTSGPTSAGP